MICRQPLLRLIAALALFSAYGLPSRLDAAVFQTDPDRASTELREVQLEIQKQTTLTRQIVGKSWRGASPSWNMQGIISLPIAQTQIAAALKITLPELSQRVAAEVDGMRGIIEKIEKSRDAAETGAENWDMLLRGALAVLGDVEFVANQPRKAIESYRLSLAKIDRQRDPAAWCIVADNLQLVLWQQGLLPDAEAVARQTLELRESVLGAEHALTLRSRSFVANLLDERGNPAAAEPLYRRALEAQERTLGKEHLDTLTTGNNLGVLLHAKGDFAGAEALFRNNVEIEQRTLGGEHLKTLMSLDNLAAVLWAKGDQAGAEALLRRIVDAEERGLGKDHPTTLLAVGKLGDLLREKGDAAGADALAQRVQEAKKRTASAKPPQILPSMNERARQAPKPADTTAALPASPAGMTPPLPKPAEDSGSLASMTAEAEALTKRGELPGAAEAYRRILEIQERTLGADDPKTLATVGQLARVLTANRDIAGAEPLYRRALAVQERTLGAEHPETLMNNFGLSIVLAQKGDTVTAEQLCTQVVRARERVLGKEHRDTIKAMFTLALLCQEQKRMTEAFRIAREAMAIVQAKFPKDDPERVKYEQQFANVAKTMTP